MEGAGNDFVVIDNFDERFSLQEIIQLTPRLCDRKFGIGADGLMALNPPTQDGLDYTMIYRNADGSDAGMCGNGSRCLAVFASKKGLGTSLDFNVHDAVYHAEVSDEHAEISFPNVGLPKRIQLNDQELVQIYSGTEHVVKIAEKSLLANEDVLRDHGATIRLDDMFKPSGTNVNFVSVDSPECLQLQTFEKGVEDLTLACGTGAIAAAISSHFLYTPEEDNSEYDIQVKGGKLGVSFSFEASSGEYSDIVLKGPGRFVFEGNVEI